MKTLTLQLSSSIAYVTGTVNGKGYTFVQQSVSEDGTTSVWTAEVDRATPDIYHCNLTAIDTRGNSDTLITTIYFGLQLVTDRTEADVEYVKTLTGLGIENWTSEELTQFLEGLKGAYNNTDLNRVESAVQYVFNRFVDNGYDYPVPAIKNTWQITEIMYSDEATRYLDNIRLLRNFITVPDGTPEVVATLSFLTYEEANNLERILEILDQCITYIEQSRVYSGEIFGGEI